MVNNPKQIQTVILVIRFYDDEGRYKEKSIACPLLKVQYKIKQALSDMHANGYAYLHIHPESKPAGSFVIFNQTPYLQYHGGIYTKEQEEVLAIDMILEDARNYFRSNWCLSI